ncbi:SGNH/GDSL hydrolase family protein [Streptomyces bauhiniae]|uniref:SGNH/GDSL hydrolase family protein n=1 Tax=Streptomyces bauhiniae TaxID=2340725 RepID=A0A4Z1D1N9_9ACTN|nr:SGNH/GDSL hydrolase family protein [Streptomyces bauhiniae]TGN75495.1 SGNH/GDSL hydrolase family protein [Streptomyces bauhiniae]
MSGRGRACRAAAVLLLALAGQATPAPAATPPAGATVRGSGVVTWAASAQRVGQGADRAYRLIVKVSAGGSDLRVRLSNAYGDRPLTVDSAHAGLQAEGAALKPGSNRALTFGGKHTVTVPPGEAVWSDPLPGRVPAGARLAVSLRTPDARGPATGHEMALTTSYLGRDADPGADGDTGWALTTGSWWYLDAVSVRPAHPRTGAVVALGDSITDGWGSTPGLDRRWPDDLARRLRADGMGVANEGMSGNRVLSDNNGGPSAGRRLERDVLSQPGVRTVILYEGVNDLKAHQGASADEIVAGYREITKRAHAAGLCVVGATVAPFKGWLQWDPKAEAVRREVNHRVRTGGDFDAVADIDRALRDPRDPARLRPDLDSGDHLHPDDDGMRAIAGAVDPPSRDCRR